MIPFTQTHRGSTLQWHRVRLGLQQLVEREHERVKMRFNRIFMTVHNPRGMCLWMVLDDDGADLYLSPRAELLAKELIRQYQAQPCAAPGHPMVLIAGEGYAAHEPDSRVVNTRTIATNRRFLPVPYSYRCVRSLRESPMPGTVLQSSGSMTPFVRRYAKAWALFSGPQ